MRFFNIDLTYKSMADIIRMVIWALVVLFGISGLVFTYLAIIFQDGDVLGGLAGVNLGAAALLAFGVGLSYL